MEISNLTPQGSILTQNDVELWREKVRRFSLEFNKKAMKADFDFGLLKTLKEQGSYDYFITPMWKIHLDKIEELLLKGDISILDNKLVRYAIYLTVASEWADKELPYLENMYPQEELQRLLLESGALNQTIVNQKYQTSESRINHLTHLTYFEEKTHLKLSKMQTLVEFGGGYGGMTALLKIIKPDNTIIVIDVPVMITLQSYYIKHTLGENCFHVLTEKDITIKNEKINYVPVSLVHLLPSNLNIDLFIATWSLSEANQYTQDLIEETNFLGAKHILYGYRHYVEKNTRQPNSAPTPKMLTFDIKFHGPSFWSLSDEQYYLFT
jgi:putative sugar O-methyltransferase